MPKLIVTDVVDIYQFTRDGNTEGYPINANYTAVNACISPTGTDIVPSGEVMAFQLFEIFIYDPTITLHNGDKIISDNGTEYILDGQPYVINNQFLTFIRCIGRQVV